MREYIKLDDAGCVDDVVLSADRVHIEDLGGRVWIGVYRGDEVVTFEVGMANRTSVVCVHSSGEVPE